MLLQVTNTPTEREKAFDAWVRRIISNGLNETKPAIVFLENNQQGMKQLYDSINRRVPDKQKHSQNKCYTLFMNGKRYALCDEVLYSALRKQSTADRQLIFMLYWENTKDFRIMQQLMLTKKSLKDRKREITEKLISAINEVV